MFSEFIQNTSPQINFLKNGGSLKENIVKNATENFLQRNNLNSSTIREACERFLWESIREMREEDPFLYEEMYNNFSSRTQTRLLEERLEMEFIDVSKIVKILSESICSCFERAIEINECDGINYTEEYLTTVMEDCCSFIEEDSKRVKELLEAEGESNGIAKMFTSVVRRLPAILPGITLGATIFGPISIGTSLIVLLGILIGSAIYSMGASMFGINVHKDQIELLKGTADVIYKAAKAVKDGTESIKHRYNVIYKNEDECYRRSGLDPQKLGIRSFAALKDQSIFRQILFFDSEERLDKLRNCYLEHYLEKISIFFELYFDCLRKTGKWNEIKEMNDDKIIAMFRMQGGLYPICDEYRDQAVKAVRNFEDLIKFFFSKDPSQKSKWMLMLNRYILDAKTSKDEQMRQHRDSYDNSKKSPFTSKKYQRLGRDV